MKKNNLIFKITFRAVLRAFLIFVVVFWLNASINSQDEKSIKDTAEINMESVLGDIRSIWPFGKCADNISGDKGFILFAFACKADYTADNRRAFLDKMLARGWQLRREDYHIDKNSATYFYKFQVDLDHDAYFKLFFRDPVVIWPLHENNRPRIIILINDVQSPDEIQKWAELKLPLTLSVSMLSEQRDEIIKTARKLNYDTWLFLPDSVQIEEAPQKQLKMQTEEQNEEIQSTENQVQPSISLNTLTRILQKKPDQYFPYTGLTISATNPIIKNIERLRMLFKLMKREGLKKFIGPSTPEIVDTAKVLDLNSANQTYFLGEEKIMNETAWQNAYENSKNNGYSVIILDSRNLEARNFLLQMIQETVNFVDYTTLEHVY